MYSKSKPRVNSKAYEAITRMFSSSTLDQRLLPLLGELPNLDPILRKAGKNTAIYNEISRDPHVIGELRSLRSGLHSFNYELVPGGEDAASMKSYELAKRFFARRPMVNTSWLDMDWHAYSAILHGFRVLHLGAYEKSDGQWLPGSVEAWKSTQFVFNQAHELKVKTAESPMGEPTDPRRWVCVRHMPEADNPYGVALLSSCFWPWTFKHGGFKFFVQLCERFGIPFPVGKYPMGADDKEIGNLLDGLAKLVEDGIAAIPDDTSVEILERKGGGEPLPERLINLCNAEISKALTSQTLATEQKGGGARAASETHAKRAGENQRADRALVADARNQIIEQLHQVNFDGGELPKFIYKDKRDVNVETVNRVKESAKLVPVSVAWAYKELGIPQPKKGETLLDVPEDGKGIATPAKSEFSFASPPELDIDGQQQFDAATDHTLKRIFEFAKAAENLEQLKTKIKDAFPHMNDSELAKVTASALEYEFAAGMFDANTTEMTE
ncbi:DUF935 family protein [Pseudoalteromonas sp. BDTF-M6]|uniref:phage portal protein family protein n=1 Tax=Pseudoalteromonas sp. BDTF-M6 TaxID=2796132 RepID=UPI001BAEA590|nr:DUF935 family protein [Pseudoalteromonas sp. BDTF-M6]MBS3796706.1 DUF935 family protein [Pseudoalteromonas sp. BDTF-M6]